MITYLYGSTTPEGIIVSNNIKTDIYYLQALHEKLKANGYQLIDYNEEGIIIEYLEISPSMATYGFETRLVNVEEKAKDNNVRIDTFTSVQMMETKNLESLKTLVSEIKTEVEDIEISKNDTGEMFYLLYEFLPEKIKKELKIHIKK